MKREVDREDEQTAFYRKYYQRVGTDRNDPRLNRGALLQLLAAEAALIRALSRISGSLEHAQLLDVGCGSGIRFFEFFRLGFRPNNVFGLDMQQERIQAGRQFLPQVEMLHGDACAMTFESDSLDFVFESGLFATLPDDEVRSSIAREMVRVCRSGGYLLLSDWRTPKYGDHNYKALTEKAVRHLFDVGARTDLMATEKGALIPPVGRFFSTYMSWLYFPVAVILPFLVGQVVYVLRKK
jgi:SAM-dependent methyltransferase